ncbi:MAG: sigma-70 family RNA polymerase sigma factor [Deltaproteobacteria bacterium]|jgi:RNA polymerase sigma-70 factor (ECF subfamily)
MATSTYGPVHVESESSITFTGWVTTLAREHTTALAQVARSEGLTADEALDAVQEAFHTFLGLPQARELVGAPDDSRALMRVIVRNAARNMRRRHHRSKPHEAIEDTAVADALPDAEALVLEAEDHVRLVGCVNKLGDVQRNVVHLRMLEELSGTEAAAALDLTPGHVAVLLHRAKKALYQCMIG